MITPSCLDPALPAPPVEPRAALLINPFYPKDPHASFGKHVLTPTLALTSVAAATPPGWRVGCWDENLLQGRPPWRPMPEVVGITVHLTFADRAYALARWYRARGTTVVLGGLHVLSCPDEAAPHADALAIGDGVQRLPGPARNGLTPTGLGSRAHGGHREVGSRRGEPIECRDHMVFQARGLRCAARLARGRGQPRPGAPASRERPLGALPKDSEEKRLLDAMPLAVPR